ncbi:MAG: N-6 DNA methylase [Marmoricola sp.]
MRRWIIESDWLEAIVALPLKMFYNTGIATYIWVLTNRKEERRKGKVQLINATEWFTPLRKNLGEKGVELWAGDIEKVLKTVEAFDERRRPGSLQGVRQRRLRLLQDRRRTTASHRRGLTLDRVYKAAEIKELKANGERSRRCAADHQEGAAAQRSRRPAARACSRRPSTAKRGWSCTSRTPTCATASRSRSTSLRARHPDGIDAFMAREVLPYAPDAWVDEGKTKIGYEISFTRHFYKPAPMRTLAEIQADIRALEAETDNLIAEIAGGVE